MGATMFIQQMLNPQPADPMQAKVFQHYADHLHSIYVVLPCRPCAVLDCNNSITILQQGLINKSVEKDRAKREEADSVKLSLAD